MASHVAFPLIAGPAVEHAECDARASGRASEHRDRNCQSLRQARGARHGGRGHRELPIMWAVKIVAKVKKPVRSTIPATACAEAEVPYCQFLMNGMCVRGPAYGSGSSTRCSA